LSAGFGFTSVFSLIFSIGFSKIFSSFFSILEYLDQTFIFHISIKMGMFKKLVTMKIKR